MMRNCRFRSRLLNNYVPLEILTYVSNTIEEAQSNSWWRHDLQTLTALMGNTGDTHGFPSKERKSQNKLPKLSICRWLETPWRYRDVTAVSDSSPLRTWRFFTGVVNALSSGHEQLHPRNRSQLVQIVVCRLFGPKPSSKPRLTRRNFYSRKCFLKFHMMTSSNGNIFRVTGPLWRESTCHRWIPFTKVSDAELWCVFFIFAWTNGWANNRDAGDLKHHRA